MMRRDKRCLSFYDNAVLQGFKEDFGSGVMQLMIHCNYLLYLCFKGRPGSANRLAYPSSRVASDC